MAYDDGSRDLILSFKHGDRTDLTPLFVRWLLRAGAPLLAEAELVAPVPLHWTCLWRRRYNQAALLASAVARGVGAPYGPRLLMRLDGVPRTNDSSRAAAQSAARLPSVPMLLTGCTGGG